MAEVRAVAESADSRPTLEGAGVRLKRAFGFQELGRFDPFLLLDVFRSDQPADYVKGFPWHPHRGIETITYILDGDVAHEDSLGNGGVISAGDVQWMTAGGGILHQELPKGDAKGRMWGFQLWANLPAAGKLMPPRYQEVKSGAIPAVKTAQGATVRVIAGTVDGTRGPVKDIVIEPEFLDVSLPAGSTFAHATDPDHTVFAFVVEGGGYFEPERAVGQDTLLLYGPGGSVLVRTESKPVRFLLVSGKPLREPVAWAGPIVMNTKDELGRAFQELEAGTFIRNKVV